MEPIPTKRRQVLGRRARLTLGDGETKRLQVGVSTSRGMMPEPLVDVCSLNFSEDGCCFTAPRLARVDPYMEVRLAATEYDMAGPVWRRTVWATQASERLCWQGVRFASEDAAAVTALLVALLSQPGAVDTLAKAPSSALIEAVL
ncbi:MAG: hypothetical protein CL878_10570 [Dehalococcoidia bacterium]|nr:hypothetical protein [Dehalococcoidia bacterium]